MTRVLTAHRQRIAGILLILGAFSGICALIVLIRVTDDAVDPSWTSARGLLAVAELVGLLVFTALVFGAWKIAGFVLRNPRVVRGDWVYIATLSVWIAYTLGASVVLTLRR